MKRTKEPAEEDLLASSGEEQPIAPGDRVASSGAVPPATGRLAGGTGPRGMGGDKKAASANREGLLSAVFYAGGAVLVFEVAGQRYGLPVGHVVQIVEIVAVTAVPAAPEIVLGVVDFRGQVTPVIDMRRRLRLPVRTYSLHTPIVICRLDGRTVGLVVDVVSGVEDLQPQQVQVVSRIFAADMGPQARYFAGVARLEDGLLLILDLGDFLSREEEKALAEALSRRQQD